MGKIKISNLSFYSYHGCFSEETKIGSDYKVDVWVEGDFSKAESSDSLDDAIDYVNLTDLVASEMEIPSKLIEHVASRIMSRISSRWPQVERAGVTIKKMHPPMNEYADSVDYTLERKQSNRRGRK